MSQDNKPRTWNVAGFQLGLMDVEWVEVAEASEVARLSAELDEARRELAELQAYLTPRLMEAEESLEVSARMCGETKAHAAALECLARVRSIGLPRQEQAPERIAELEAALGMVLELVSHETDLPNSAANGNTDPTGTIDEGVVRAWEILQHARRLLPPDPKEQAPATPEPAENLEDAVIDLQQAKSFYRETADEFAGLLRECLPMMTYDPVQPELLSVRIVKALEEWSGEEESPLRSEEGNR